MLTIWDVSTRIYHWLQALLFIALLISAYSGFGNILGLSNKEIHVALGTLLSLLIMWRIGWGFIGSETSRFTQFTPSASTLWHYIRGQHLARAGHNPVAALMVMVLIGLLFLQASLGLIMSDWIEGKELLGRSAIKTIKQIHEVNALLLTLLSLAHIAAAIIHRFKGQQIIAAMIHGKLSMPSQITQPIMASNVKSIFLFIGCCISFIGLMGFVRWLS